MNKKYLIRTISLIILFFSACSPIMTTQVTTPTMTTPVTTPTKTLPGTTPAQNTSLKNGIENEPIPTATPWRRSLDISFAKNYFFPTKTGIRIISDIPKGIDAIQYINTYTGESIAISSTSRQVIDYLTSLERIIIRMIPIKAGKEISDSYLETLIIRKQEGNVVTIRYDARDSSRITVTYVIPSQKELAQISSDWNFYLVNLIDDLIAVDENGKEETAIINRGLNSVNGLDLYMTNIGMTSFPSYIGYVIPSRYINTGTYATGYDTILADFESLFFWEGSVLFKGRGSSSLEPQTFTINLSLPANWIGILEKNGVGYLFPHSEDYLTYPIDSECDFIAGFAEFQIKEYLLSSSFTLRFAWLKNHDSPRKRIADPEYFEKTAQYFDYLINKIGKPDVDNELIFIIPNPRFSDYIVFSAHPGRMEGQNSIDTHGIIRRWLGYSPEFDWSDPESGKKLWLIGAGFSDTFYFTKSLFTPGKSGDLYSYRELDLPNDLSPYSIPSLPALTKLYFEKVLNSKADMPVTKFDGLTIGPPNELYMFFRFVKIDLITDIFDMLLHSSSDGKITDGLELLGDIYQTNQAQKIGFTINGLFNSISKFSNYDFNNFFNAYIINGKRLNIDYEMTDINTITAFGDYSNTPLSIDNVSTDEFQVTGNISQDSYIGLTSLLKIDSIYVNTMKVEKLYHPWGEPEHIASFFVPKGNFQIIVKTHK